MIKKILVLMMLLNTSAFADCRPAYEQASHRLDVRNMIIVGGVAVGAGVGAVAVGTGVVMSTLIGISNASLLPGAIVTSGKMNNGEDYWYKNKFDRIILAYEAAKKNDLSDEYFQKFVRKTAKELGRELSSSEELNVQQFLIQGFENNIFCSLVRVKKNGKKIWSVFSQELMAQYVAESL